MALNSVIPLLINLVLLWSLPPFFCIFKFFHMLYSFILSENVKGKVVLITGASSGIGEQLAYEYAKRGANLVIVARRENLLKKVAEKARTLGAPDVVPVCADVVNVDDCKRFVEGAVNHFGQLDHVVNNAGIASECSIEDAIDITKFASVMASKAAVISFYEIMRVELTPEISITMATLGLIDSEMTRGKQLSKEGIVEVDKESSEAIIDQLPVMSSSDSAKAIVHGICRKERYVTEPKMEQSFLHLEKLMP